MIFDNNPGSQYFKIYHQFYKLITGWYPYKCFYGNIWKYGKHTASAPGNRGSDYIFHGAAIEN